MAHSMKLSLTAGMVAGLLALCAAPALAAPVTVDLRIEGATRTLVRRPGHDRRAPVPVQPGREGRATTAPARVTARRGDRRRWGPVQRGLERRVRQPDLQDRRRRQRRLRRRDGSASRRVPQRHGSRRGCVHRLRSRPATRSCSPTAAFDDKAAQAHAGRRRPSRGERRDADGHRRHAAPSRVRRSPARPPAPTGTVTVGPLTTARRQRLQGHDGQGRSAPTACACA